MTTWLLDTNALIHWFKRAGKDIFNFDFQVSVLTAIEFPVITSFSGFHYFHSTPSIFRKSVGYANTLRKNGTLIPAVDIILATTAVEKKSTLVSDDEHYAFFQDIEPGLRCITLDIFLKENKKKVRERQAKPIKKD